MASYREEYHDSTDFFPDPTCCHFWWSPVLYRCYLLVLPRPDVKNISGYWISLARTRRTSLFQKGHENHGCYLVGIRRCDVDNYSIGVMAQSPPASRSGVRACVRAVPTPPRTLRPCPPPQKERRREPWPVGAPRCARPAGEMPPAGRSSVGLACRPALRFSPYPRRCRIALSEGPAIHGDRMMGSSFS